MKFILSLTVVMLCCLTSYTQHRLSILISHAENKLPLNGATAHISSLNRTEIADTNGLIVFNDLPQGTYPIILSYAGLKEQRLSIVLPQEGNAALLVSLEVGGDEEEEEVIVMATRTSRSISDIPTRVETISGEELNEKSNMKPGDIRMLLSESTGIQTQQTSATSYNSSIRIQGLDGRYTQILRDGFPLYAGFSGGLSLMQVAPLDLKQIEVIKGSTSTLYGGGAIAGLVNLVSRNPGPERELNFIANGTSAGGLDLSGFYSQRFRKFGITMYGSRNTAKAYDPAGIGLTAIPKFERYTANPRLFFYGSKTTADIGVSYIKEDRIGGSIDFIKNGTPGYFENNRSGRVTTQAQLTRRLSDKSFLTFKNSYSRFNRFIEIPGYTFEGLQQSTFSEATYNKEGEKMHWVAGLNYLTDHFSEDRRSTLLLRDYSYNTYGVFLQNTWSPVETFTLEAGLRGDYVKEFGFELLPRFSAMLKLTSALTLRLGGGSGYKTPTLFNEESERRQYANILPINESSVRNENSGGANFDVNYRASLGDVGFTINQLFFYTRLNHPLVLSSSANGSSFINADGHLDTKGMETNLRFTYSDFKLFIGYTYADVNTHYNNVKSWFPLTARHRLNNVLMYEKEENLKIGLEAYYFSKQKLSDGIGRPYWTFGLMGEKLWEKFSVFINFENFTDTRQSEFDTIYTGTINDPMFRDIYAPVDGFVFNGGIKLKL